MSGLWGGRFAGGQAERFLAFQESLSVDARLWREDLVGSMAWARALAGAGALTEADAERLCAELEALGAELDADPTALHESEAEDVHSFVEGELVRRLGDLGKRLHTGRSRNDQVATDLRLHLRAVAYELDGALEGVQLALVELAERDADLALPGFTHLQPAQPITAGHHALAYVEMLARDRERVADARRRMDRCPLGSGALAGTAWPVDRDALAADLGFLEGPTANSLDAVSDRDHCVELVFACSLTMVHLSRLAEDWIFLCSQGLLEFGDAVCTGSSLMPQKKNPDALELIRGRAGAVLGDLHALLVLVKGLPLAYMRDLQEDKHSLFHALDSTTACLEVAALAVSTARYDAERCRAAAGAGHQNATDLADLLVREGVPFRDAHERSGFAVRRALELGCALEALPAADRAELLPELGPDLTAALSVDAVLARRDVVGGTAPARVRAVAAAWREHLEEA